MSGRCVKHDNWHAHCQRCCSEECDALRAERDTWQQRAVDGAQAALKATIELATTKGREERLLAALVGLVDYERRRYPPRMGGDEYPPSLRKAMAVANAALAEKPEGGGR